MSEMFVIGAGGHAKVVIAALQSAHKLIDGVLDDNKLLHGLDVQGVRVRGGLDMLETRPNVRAVIAVGSNEARRAIATRFPSVIWEIVIHPNAWVATSAHLEAGTVICAGAVVQPDARLGKHCIVNTLASVDHDCCLGDFVHLAPGVRLAGNVRIGDGALVGVAAHAVPKTQIGEWSVVGAGATVVDDLPAFSVSFGNPARVKRKVAS